MKIQHLTIDISENELDSIYADLLSDEHSYDDSEPESYFLHVEPRPDLDPPLQLFQTMNPEPSWYCDSPPYYPADYNEFLDYSHFE